MTFRLPALPLLLALALFPTLLARAQEDGGLIIKVGRLRSCIQTNRDAAWPDILSLSPYCFYTVAQMVDGFSTISRATIQPPGLTPMTIPPLDGFPGIFGRLDCGTVEQELDADYPPGTYEFVVNYDYFSILPDTFQTSIRLESNAYPNTPYFLGIDPNIPVSSASDLPLSWTPFMAGGEEDGMLVQIFRTTNFITGEGEVAFQMAVPVSTPNPHVTIPANTLMPNLDYHALLTFDRVFDSKFEVHDVAELGVFDLYVLTQSTFTKNTRMPFRTTSSSRPFLTVISGPGETPFRFSFPAVVGKEYQILVSSNLVDWSTTRTTNAATTQVIYEEPLQPTGQRFFQTLSP